jgi:hypothetical protein
VVASWAEHLRQHERVTMADRAIEESAHSRLIPGTEPAVSHFIAMRSIAGKARRAQKPPSG